MLDRQHHPRTHPGQKERLPGAPALAARSLNFDSNLGSKQAYRSESLLLLRLRPLLLAGCSVPPSPGAQHQNLLIRTTSKPLNRQSGLAFRMMLSL